MSPPEFLRLLFLQAHRETTAHFLATGLPSQQNRSDNAFRFKRAAFYMGLKSKVGLVAAKASALRINLKSINIQGCVFYSEVFQDKTKLLRAGGKHCCSEALHCSFADACAAGAPRAHLTPGQPGPFFLLFFFFSPD